MNQPETSSAFNSLHESGVPEHKDKKDDETSSSKKKSEQSSFRFLGGEVNNESKSESPRFSLFELKDDKENAVEDREETPEDAHEEDRFEDLPLDHLSGEEVQEYVQESRAKARDSRSHEASDDEVEQMPNDAIDDWDSLVVDEGIEPTEAERMVLDYYGIDPIEAKQVEDNELSEPEAEPVSKEAFDILSGAEEGEIPLETAQPEAPKEDTNEAAIPPPASGGGSGRSGGGGGRKPPPTFAAGGAGNTPPQPNPWRSTRFSPNVMPPGTVSTGSYNQIRLDHRDYWSGFMTGGIVGYYVGHRRGRIKTEKKLQRVKKNLEKQINSIDKDLKTQEFKIRKLVRERAIAKPEKVQPMRVERAVSQRVPEVAKTIKKEVLAPIAAAEIHIGKLVMSERPREAVRREEIKEPVNVTKQETVEHSTPVETRREISVDSMNHNELLKASEDVIIDGTSLRQIYETQLIGEKGLRRLLNEYVRGGDLQRALKSEVLERQIDFERDPAMRDTAAPSVSGAGVNDSQSLERMIKRAEAALTNSQEEVAFLKAKAAHEDKQQYKHTRAINAVFLSIITFLVAIIVLIGILRIG